MRAPRKLLAFNVYYFDTQVPQDQSFNKSRKDPSNLIYLVGIAPQRRILKTLQASSRR